MQTTYASEYNWNGTDLPFWSITVGPPFKKAAKGIWKTLFTCIDETGLAGAEETLGEYDEIWVPLPCQIDKIKSAGYVGDVVVVRPAISWEAKPGDGDYVWVGTDVDRKQKPLMKQWAKDININIVEVNRWKNMLSNKEYSELIQNSKGLIVTSRSEGYGIPVREFAFSGKPVYGIELPEYEGLVFNAENSEDLAKCIFERDKIYHMPMQLQSPIRRFENSDFSGWFGTKTKCGVQSHHHGLCQALNIPVVESINYNHKLFVSFHDFYANHFFENVPNQNIKVFDIHSITDIMKQKLIGKYPDVVYIGHRNSHIDRFKNNFVIPLYTRAKRVFVKKENIIYHSGLLSRSKHYKLFFKSAILDKDSGFLWRIDLSIPHFYSNQQVNDFKTELDSMKIEAKKYGANIELNFFDYMTDEYRYYMIEKSKVCIVLYNEGTDQKDASAFIHDATYLRTPCICDPGWISEWDQWTTPWIEKTPERLVELVDIAKHIYIPFDIPCSPDKVLSKYMDILSLC